MANVRTPVLSGISEFGDVTGETAPYDGLGTDAPYGATERNGVTIQVTGEDVDVQSGQNLVLEDSFASARSIELTARLQHSGLLNIKDALGMPDAALTGDLATIDEVLAFNGTNIASEEKTIYVLSPGPNTTRRIQAQRCKQRAGLTLELASNDYLKLETTWTILDGGTGIDEMQILDSFA